jgi:hypothetical protein
LALVACFFYSRLKLGREQHNALRQKLDFNQRIRDKN